MLKEPMVNVSSPVTVIDKYEITFGRLAKRDDIFSLLLTKAYLDIANKQLNVTFKENYNLSTTHRLMSIAMNHSKTNPLHVRVYCFFEEEIIPKVIYLQCFLLKSGIAFDAEKSPNSDPFIIDAIFRIVSVLPQLDE